MKAWDRRMEGFRGGGRLLPLPCNKSRSAKAETEKELSIITWSSSDEEEEKEVGLAAAGRRRELVTSIDFRSTTPGSSKPAVKRHVLKSSSVSKTSLPLRSPVMKCQRGNSIHVPSSANHPVTPRSTLSLPQSRSSILGSGHSRPSHLISPTAKQTETLLGPVSPPLTKSLLESAARQLLLRTDHESAPSDTELTPRAPSPVISSHRGAKRRSAQRTFTVLNTSQRSPSPSSPSRSRQQHPALDQTVLSPNHAPTSSKVPRNSSQIENSISHSNPKDVPFGTNILSSPTKHPSSLILSQLPPVCQERTIETPMENLICDSPSQRPVSPIFTPRSKPTRRRLKKIESPLENKISCDSPSQRPESPRHHERNVEPPLKNLICDSPSQRPVSPIFTPRSNPTRCRLKKIESPLENKISCDSPTQRSKTPILNPTLRPPDSASSNARKSESPMEKIIADSPSQQPKSPVFTHRNRSIRRRVRENSMGQESAIMACSQTQDSRSPVVVRTRLNFSNAADVPSELTISIAPPEPSPPPSPAKRNFFISRRAAQSQRLSQVLQSSQESCASQQIEVDSSSSQPTPGSEGRNAIVQQGGGPSQEIVSGPSNSPSEQLGEIEATGTSNGTSQASEPPPLDSARKNGKGRMVKHGLAWRLARLVSRQTSAQRMWRHEERQRASGNYSRGGQRRLSDLADEPRREHEAGLRLRVMASGPCWGRGELLYCQAENSTGETFLVLLVGEKPPPQGSIITLCPTWHRILLDCGVPLLLGAALAGPPEIAATDSSHGPVV